MATHPEVEVKAGFLSTDGDSGNGSCQLLTQQQWELVRTMRVCALRDSPAAFLGTFEEEDLLHKDDWLKTFLLASWHGFFIAREIVGIAKSTILTEHPEERYVESFWVDPRHRGRQVGHRILQNIVAEARAEQRSAIRLSVLRTNQPAVEIFQHWGFSPVADRSDICEICLELSIG